MRTTRCATRFVVVTSVVLVLLSTALVTLAFGRETPTDSSSSLPMPFRWWNVRLEPLHGDPGVLELAFDSPLLHRRVTNRVYLPTGYADRSGPWPVLYYRHGTTPTQLNNRTVDPVTQPPAALIRRTPALWIAGLFPSGSGVQADLFRFDHEADRAKFVVVAPDAEKAEPF